VGKVRVHILLDGRDVPATSALEYVEPFEAFLADLSDGDFDAKIASGGGRMKITMDRYGADWSMVQRGWDIHVMGDGPAYPNTSTAIKDLRDQNPGIGDQDLPGFVIQENGESIGKIVDNDSVIFFNFRGDRALEISQAFENENVSNITRSYCPKVTYAGMLQYDGDDMIPARFLVAPPSIKNTMGEQIASTGLTQLAISETQKYGHVTYFWNGNRSGMFDDSKEKYIEIPSDVIPFEQRPWMKAAEITDALIKELKAGQYDFARVNYANGDMVGHTGDYQASMIAVATVDACLSRLLKVIDELKGIAIITADHGNADEMYEINKKTKEPKQNKDGSFVPKTAHTLNPVPCILFDNVSGGKLSLEASDSIGLSNVASTALNIAGYEAPESWDSSILKVN
ncbi:MAG: 2,3-bisphosphoglycerate-independent phosphoglycerate mutase, partial [Planctomycetes bacterium]|nr:2,3-bisphosphoglycerate-independent phosphoglycerate mutase [Planctomycetota bacterium]